MSSFLIDCEGTASTITLAERIADEILFVKFTIFLDRTYPAFWNSRITN